MTMWEESKDNAQGLGKSKPLVVVCDKIPATWEGKGLSRLTVQGFAVYPDGEEWQQVGAWSSSIQYQEAERKACDQPTFFFSFRPGPQAMGQCHSQLRSVSRSQLTWARNSLTNKLTTNINNQSSISLMALVHDLFTWKTLLRRELTQSLKRSAVNWWHLEGRTRLVETSLSRWRSYSDEPLTLSFPIVRGSSMLSMIHT